MDWELFIKDKPRKDQNLDNYVNLNIRAREEAKQKWDDTGYLI